MVGWTRNSVAKDGEVGELSSSPEALKEISLDGYKPMGAGHPHQTVNLNNFTGCFFAMNLIEVALAKEFPIMKILLYSCLTG